MIPSDDESDRAREGSSDATPGGLPDLRRPGELAFTLFLVVASGILLWQAYDIAGFRRLSSPGAIPMAATGVMLVTALLVLWKTLRKPPTRDETLRIAVFPFPVVLMALMLLGYGLLLKPLGFLPTSALFLVIAIRVLSGRSLWFSLGVSLLALAIIWLVFRMVFTVLMPAGLFPEAEMVQFFRTLFAGAR